jgi:DNA-binding response OmpR family regulator
MSTPGGSKRILLIDRQELWRAPAARALEASGFTVFESADFESLSGQGDGLNIADLVVLGCASIGSQERSWIDAIVTRGWPLLVLSATLPWDVMRSVFLAGADDVTEKPYEPERLATIIDRTLTTIASRDEYSAVLRRRTL